MLIRDLVLGCEGRWLRAATQVLAKEVVAKALEAKDKKGKPIKKDQAT